jgi:hypothetical protein
MIGGVLYKNVKNPLVVNGRPLIKFSRNEETDILGVSLEVRGESGLLIASVVNNDVEKINVAFSLLKGENRVSVIRNDNGQVFLDLMYGIRDREYEIELSMFSICDGYPVILHPERTKCGAFNDGNAPNISRLTLTTEKGAKATGISITNSTIYLLGIFIENFLNGVSITVRGGNGAK